MKASSIRKIAEQFTLAELANAAEVIAEEERVLFAGSCALDRDLDRMHVRVRVLVVV